MVISSKKYFKKEDSERECILVPRRKCQLMVAL